MRNFFKGISNLWYYRKVIWQDRWWDHAFMVEIVERTLARHYDGLADPKRAIAEHTPKELRKLKTAHLLAKRLVDCVHCDKAGHDLIEAKYGKHTIDKFFDRSLQTKEEMRAWERWAIHSNDLEKQDWNMLWDLIKKYGQHWWD